MNLGKFSSHNSWNAGIAMENGVLTLGNFGFKFGFKSVELHFGH
jgi:hypothetical protein